MIWKPNFIIEICMHRDMPPGCQTLIIDAGIAGLFDHPRFDPPGRRRYRNQRKARSPHVIQRSDIHHGEGNTWQRARSHLEVTLLLQVVVQGQIPRTQIIQALFKEPVMCHHRVGWA